MLVYPAIMILVNFTISSVNHQPSQITDKQLQGSKICVIEVLLFPVNTSYLLLFYQY